MSQQHQILVGDCIDMMRTLPEKSVHSCVTSPPYFRLRDYGVEGQIGLEKPPPSSSCGWSECSVKCAECFATTARSG